MRRGSRRSFSGLLITVALHGVIFWTVKAAHSRPQEPIIVQRDFVQAEMVKLGKPRDKFWLPKVHTAPPPPPPDAIKLADDPNAKPAPGRGAEDRGPEDVEGRPTGARARARSWARWPSPRNRTKGALNGSKIGDIRSARSAISTTRQVMGAITAELQPAGRDERPTRFAQPPEIRFRIASDGTLSDVKLIEVVRQSAGRRCLRQRRAADAQGPAASAGVEGHGPTPSPARSNRSASVLSRKSCASRDRTIRLRRSRSRQSILTRGAGAPRVRRRRPSTKTCRAKVFGIDRAA